MIKHSSACTNNIISIGQGVFKIRIPCSVTAKLGKLKFRTDVALIFTTGYIDSNSCVDRTGIGFEYEHYYRMK